MCEDERQYVGHVGQRWSSLAELRQRDTVVEPIEPGLWGIETRPSFAIGQRAHLVQTPRGNVMWECVSSISDDNGPRATPAWDVCDVEIS